MRTCAFSQIQHDRNSEKRKKDRQRISDEIKTVLREFEDHPEQAAAFERLLSCVRSRTRLLQPTPGRASLGWGMPAFLIKRLRNVASRQSLWLRDPESWRPADESLRRSFRSLAHHLFAYYPVPAFMDSVWDSPISPESFRHESWYVRLGRGASLRELNLPFPLTRQMEHHARQAPDHCTIVQGPRYGEIRGLGGSVALARNLILGRLGRTTEHAGFWRSVLLFFVNHPEMEVRHANPIIDFIYHHKFGGEELVGADGTVVRAPLSPAFSMQGRSLKSLLRLVDAWHRKLGLANNDGSFSWPSSGLEGYRCEQEDGREWNIRELVGSDALFEEGRTMRHCVYTYARPCRRRECSIWSLRLRIENKERRMATIEVDSQINRIVQVRAKCNRAPAVGAMEIIRQWAAMAGLRVALRV